MVVCPAKCSGGQPFRQASLVPSQRAEIGEPWAADATRCAYCGAVYTRALDGLQIRGELDSMEGPGWHPGGGKI